jgi:hypothetical protein
MRRSLPPLRCRTLGSAAAQHCLPPGTFDRLSAADSFDSSSQSSCRILSDAPRVRGCVDSQNGKQEFSAVKRHSDQGAPLCVEAFPHCALRLTPQNIGVDVAGCPNLGLACQQFHRESAVSGLHLRTPAGSTNAHQGVSLYEMASRRRDDQLERGPATPFLRRKYELSNKL